MAGFRPALRSQLSASASGSATPEASYGTHHAPDMAYASESLDPWRPEPRRRSFTPSQERLVYNKKRATSRDRLQQRDDPFDELDDDELFEAEEPTPVGVRKMLAISASLSRRQLFYIYAAVILISAIMSTEGQVTPAIEPYFLSLFSAHALLSTMGVVSQIAYAIGKPPMAQLLDHYGRAEGLAVGSALYAIGHTLTAFSGSVAVYAVARVLSALGWQGMQLAQQVLIADTTTLSNRGVVMSVSSLPWMVTIWLGPPIAQVFLNFGSIGYRLSYGLFGVLVPALVLPLIWALWWHHTRLQQERDEARLENGTRSKRRIVSMASVQTTGSWMDKQAGTLFGSVWRQLDILGLVLLSVCCVALLLPLSLAATTPSSWSSSWVWLSFGLSVLSGWLFHLHEKSAERPILPSRLLHNTTLMAGCFLGLFHFLCVFTYESYFSSYLQVARQRTVVQAQYITQAAIFAATGSAFFAGLLCKWTRSYKIWAVLGVLVHLVGAVLILHSRREDSSIWEIVVAQIVSGVGGGFTTITMQLGIQASVAHEDVARATAALLTITQLGGALGSACSGALWSTILPMRLRDYLPDDHQADIERIMGSLSVALSFEEGSSTRTAIDRAYSATQHVLNMASLLGLLPALVCLWLMKDVHLGAPSEGVVTMGAAASVGGVAPSEALLGDEED